MRNLILVFFVLTIAGCNYEKNNPTSEKSTKFQTIYKGDEVTCFLLFNIDDILIEQNCVNENSEKHGPYITYHENGSIYRMHYYKHGQLNGMQYGFSKDGIKEYEIASWEDKKNGNATFFDSKGSLKRYDYNIDDRTVYRAKYDENRNLIKEEGRLISPIVFMDKIDSLKASGKYEAHIYFIDPPHGSPDIAIYTTNERGDTVHKDVPDLDTIYYKFNFYTDIPGGYYFNYNIKIDTEDDNAIKEHTLSSPLEVLWESTNTP